MKPKLMFCSQSAYTGGGMEAWMESLAGQLEKKGWEVMVALAEGKRFHNPKKYLEVHKHKHTMMLDGTLGYRECRVDSLLRAFRAWKPDVVIPVGLADALYAAALWKKKDGKAKLVTCLHSQSKVVLNDIKVCAPYIDLAVSVSRRGLTILQEELLGLEINMAHIPTGVPKTVVAREKSYEDDVLDLVYVGRLDNMEKRVLDLIPFVRLLGNNLARMHIVGSGPEERRLRNSLDQQIRDGLVVFHGQLSREALYREIYPRMDVLLLFSPAEGGPIVAWEAMINGVVPIVSDFKGRRDEGVIRANKNGLVFPVGNVADAVTHIKLLQDPRERKRLSQNARNLPNQYCEDRFAEKWDKNLRKCIETERKKCRDKLPQMVSPGRYAMFHMGYKFSSLIRNSTRKSYRHKDAGGEWPSIYLG